MLAAGCRPINPEAGEYTKLQSDASKGQPSLVGGEFDRATTPRIAYETFRKAVQERDFDMCWKLVSKDTRELYDRRAADFKMLVLNSPDTTPKARQFLEAMGLSRLDLDKVNGQRFFIGEMRLKEATDPKSFEQITRTEFLRQEIKGDKAKVFVTLAGNAEPEPMNLAREGGLWRVDLRPRPQP
jgi:hypothetical protein